MAAGAFADTAELAALARPLRARGLPYASHMRNEDDELLAAIEETLQVGRIAGVQHDQARVVDPAVGIDEGARDVGGERGQLRRGRCFESFEIADAIVQVIRNGLSIMGVEAVQELN